MLLTLRIWTDWACGHGYRRENWSMRIRQFKLIGIIAFCAVAVICVSLLAWLDMALAVVLVLLLLVVSAVAYYGIDKKKSRFEAHTDFIYQGYNKQFVKAAEVETPRADEEVEQAVASGTSGDEVDTAAQGGEIASFLADDPSYHKMIDMFVNNLPKRLEEMQEALDEGNLQDLALKIHALKGLGSFAGFPIYTEKAEVLEQAIMDNQVDKVREQLDEMVRLCLKTKMTHR